MFQIPISDEERRNSDSLEDHATELGVLVFHEDPEPIVTRQPRVGDAVRRPVPVVTRDSEETSETHFLPRHGLDFLSGTHKVHIQQTVELHDLLNNVASENRYTVKIPRGDTIYYAVESSESFQRSCLGSSRAFQMKLFDQTRQECLQFNRRLACGVCSWACYLQALEVWVPGELVGEIRQQISLGPPVFFVYNRDGFVVYKIEGPSSCMCIVSGKQAYFRIFSSDGTNNVGSINHQWDQVSLDYNVCLQYPGGVDVKHKALLMGAAFLLEYMYFESSRSVRCCRC